MVEAQTNTIISLLSKMFMVTVVNLDISLLYITLIDSWAVNNSIWSIKFLSSNLNG